MIEVEEEAFVRAPWQRVAEIYADYRGWPGMFPTIRGVRLLRDEPGRTVVEVDHREGMVVNVLTTVSPHEIRLDEFKRRFDGTFVNRFEPAAGGSRYRVRARIQLKGALRLLAPFVGGYVRRQIRELVLAPVRARAEAAVG